MKGKQQIDQAKAALWVLTAHILTPIVKVIGEIKAPYSEKRAICHFYKMQKVLKPLDIILSNTYGHLSNVMNPGPWKHVIIYIGKENGIPMIIEAIGKGVVKRPLAECIAEKDEFAILRYHNYDNTPKKKIDEGIRWLNKQVGKDYDYLFDLFSTHKFENYYCSELGYYAHKRVFKNYEMEPRVKLGVPTITPSDTFYAVRIYNLILTNSTLPRTTS